MGMQDYIFFGRGDDIYVAVFKPTTNPITGTDELHLDSFRRSSRYELDRQRRRLEVVT